MNLDNPSDTAVRIGRGELSAVCRAVGVMEPNDSSELHDRPLIVKVGRRISKYDGDVENVIKGYEKAGSQGQPPQAASNTVPWARS